MHKLIAEAPDRVVVAEVEPPAIYDMLNYRPQEAGAVLLRWDT